jgi:hypothetical protein
MRIAIVLGCVLGAAAAHAQASIDALDKLRACSALDRSERVECLNRLASDIGPPPAAAPAATTQPSMAREWIISETTSPLDYSPVAIARSTSPEKDNLDLLLSIQCRAGRSELVLAASNPLAGRAEEYLFTYSVNGSASLALPLTAAATGSGLAVKADPARLLNSLPPAGEIVFRLAHARGPSLEGRYALDQLRAVTLRLTTPCRWPSATTPGRP